MTVAGSDVEAATLGWFEELGYTALYGPTLLPQESTSPERANEGHIVLIGRLRAALAKLNPTVPTDALEEAIRKLTRIDTPSLIENNHRFHRLLVEGVEVNSYQ